MLVIPVGGRILFSQTYHNAFPVFHRPSCNWPCDLARRYELRRQLLERFWSCWVNEYLCSLPPCKSAAVNKGGIQVGSVVLIRGEGTRRLQWPLGVVKVVYPGRDGLVRSVQMKTAKGLLTRPIQRVHNLEIIESLNVPSQ